jgi:hypothetical protein
LNTGIFTITATTPDGRNAERMVMIDRTAPVLTPSFDPSTVEPQSLVLSAVDSGSGVASITWSATGALSSDTQTVLGDSVTIPLDVVGVTTVTATTRDRAGNVSARFTGEYVVEVLSPSAVATVSPEPNANGVHTSRPVTVQITAVPGSSPIASITVNGAPQTLTGNVATFNVMDDGMTTVDYVVTDTTGRFAAGSLVVRIDTTPPEITCPSVPSFLLNDPGATLTATVSGGTVASLTKAAATTTPGLRSVSFSTSDSNGNVGTKSCDYNVRYRVQGFYEPITPTALNVATAGRNIPVKWRLTDFNNVPVATASSFLSIAVSPVTCGALPADVIEAYTDITSSSLQYNGDGNWQYNWKTAKSLKGGCQRLRVNLADGTSLTATFSFR